MVNQPIGGADGHGIRYGTVLSDPIEMSVFDLMVGVFVMRSLKSAAIAAFFFAAAAVPATAAVVVSSGNVGYQFQIDYTGQVGGQTTPQVSALGDFTFTGLTNNGLTYNFNYSLLNDSTTTARLSGFAFNTSPNPTSGVVTGAFNQINSGNYPEGFGFVDVCFTDGGGACAGGGSGGFFENQTGTGTFALTFAQVMESVAFDEFVTRFQSIGGVQAGSSGIGIGALIGPGGDGSDPMAVPEPGTWLMMLGGFGLVGFAMRRRETRTLRPQIA